MVAAATEALRISARTIEHLKRCFVERGLEAVLQGKPQAMTFDGSFETRLVSLACSQAPADRVARRSARWQRRPPNWS